MPTITGVAESVATSTLETVFSNPTRWRAAFAWSRRFGSCDIIGRHGWQWARELYLKDSSVLTYDRPLHKEHRDQTGREYRKAVFAYFVRSVDESGKESGPSSAWFTMSSSPQQVFSKEEGLTCRLKWGANPEKGITGYRVYRRDGRFDKELVSHLTADPIMAATFADENARKLSRRNYILAVDAIGQQGFLLSPVWFNREWCEFYKPFVGEWHQ